jgi:hypothetical protein
MLAKKLTVSVRLDPTAARRLKREAQLKKQSRGAFLEQAGDESAHRVLLEWAVAPHRAGLTSFCDLAEDTGLAIEELLAAAGGQDQDVEAHQLARR